LPEWTERETARLAQGRAAGARGVKVYKSLGLSVRDAEGRVPADSAKLDALWRSCGQLGLVVAVHAADPRAFFEPPGPGNERAEELAAAPGWSFADRSRFPAWRTVFGEFVRMVERHPGTTFIGVHFGNDAEDPEEVSRLLGRLPNLYVDTAARVPELGRRAEAARAAILAHPDRVLFGTDLQWVEGRDLTAVVLGAGPAFVLGGIPLERSVEGRRFFDGTFRFFETRDRGLESPTPIQGRWAIDGIGLPREVLERVYHRNAERLLGLAPPEGP
jgi:predicted TIM-barrel fold metal-dependent hydrolase